MTPAILGRLKMISGTLMQVTKTWISKIAIAQSKILLSKRLFFTIQREININGIMSNIQTYFIDGRRKNGAVIPIRNSCTQSIKKFILFFFIFFFQFIN